MEANNMQENLQSEVTAEVKAADNSNTQKRLRFGEREIILVGTAHVSAKSVEEVKQVILEEKPDNVAIELDEGRLKSMEDPESWRKMDIMQVMKKKQGFLMLANIVLASYQKKMGKGQETEVRPGDEMFAAINTARELGIPQTMVDRPIAVTLRRAWAKNSLWGKCKLLSALIASAFSSEDVSADQIESLKNNSEMDNMMKELSEYLPKVKEVLIDERDRYLASHIWECSGNKIVAVLGAGHLPGVMAWLEKLSAGEAGADCEDISQVPPKKAGAKIAGWIIPVLIVAIIALGFVYGGMNMGGKMVGAWILWNGILAALGAIIAGGHPVTILVSLVSAPFTSLCPFVGVGFVAGIVQAAVCKPKIKDMEAMTDDAVSLKGFYRNRILRVLLVFLLSSLGSTLGTFVAGASLVAAITTFFDRIVEAIKALFVK